MSIGDHNAGGAQWRYPVPPGLAQRAAPLVLCGVVITTTALALPQGREGGSRSWSSRHSPHNTHSHAKSVTPLDGALRYPQMKIWEERSVPVPTSRAYMRSLCTDQNSPPHIKRRENQRETQVSMIQVHLPYISDREVKGFIAIMPPWTISTPSPSKSG
jgi:hypothetical protein